MSLKDFLAKQPINVIIQTEITENKITLPADIDSKAFYKEFDTAIDSEVLTDEKAIYIASIHGQSPMITYRDMLSDRLHF